MQDLSQNSSLLLTTNSSLQPQNFCSSWWFYYCVFSISSCYWSRCIHFYGYKSFLILSWVAMLVLCGIHTVQTGTPINSAAHITLTANSRRASSGTWWPSTCLACVRHWVWSQTQQKNSKAIHSLQFHNCILRFLLDKKGLLAWRGMRQAGLSSFMLLYLSPWENSLCIFWLRILLNWFLLQSAAISGAGRCRACVISTGPKVLYLCPSGWLSWHSGQKECLRKPFLPWMTCNNVMWHTRKCLWPSWTHLHKCKHTPCLPGGL